MPTTPFKPLGDWLLKFYGRLPDSVKRPFALVFVFLFVLLWFIPLGAWFSTSPLLEPAFWVNAGLLILCTIASIVFYFWFSEIRRPFQESDQLSDAHRAVFRRLVDLLEGRVDKRDPKYLPNALECPKQFLCDLFERLAG